MSFERRFAQLFWLLLILACARMEPPSGGAVDRISPLLTGSSPVNGSTGSGAISRVSLGFSEPVDRASVLENLRIDPRRVLRGAHWQSDTLLVLDFWDPLPADTSFAVYLLPGWRDRHRVEQREWQFVHFATGDSLLPGWLGGKATFKGNPNPAMHLEFEDGAGELVRAFRPDQRGEFVLRHLPVDGRPLRLIAWQDADGDSLFDPAIDFADTLADSSLALTRARPTRLNVKIDVIDPLEPGKLSGSFTDRDSVDANYHLLLFPDSLRVAGDSIPAGNAALLPDSLLARLGAPSAGPQLWLREAGSYGYDGLPPGAWWLIVYKDLTGDSLWTPASEAAHLEPGPLRLDPGGTVTVRRFEIQPPAAKSDSSATHGDSLPAGAGGEGG